jgi:uncharacterized protein (DUF305 family)
MKQNNTNLYISLTLIVFTLIGGLLLTNIGSKSPQSNKNTQNMAQDVDLDFLQGMVEHHMGALDMAKQVKIYSSRQELQVFADVIILEQSKEIEQMNRWRNDWYKDTNMIAMKMGGKMSMQQDLGKANDEFDRNFLNAMTVHHNGAIAMAKEILNTTKNKELQKLAGNIISAQTKEIEQMDNWKKLWYK